MSVWAGRVRKEGANEVTFSLQENAKENPLGEPAHDYLCVCVCVFVCVGVRMCFYVGLVH